MCKYQSIPVTVEAKIYEEGMEDGFIRYNEYIPKDANSYPEECRSTEHPGYHKTYDSMLNNKRQLGWVPYIEMNNGEKVVIPTDTDVYIVTNIYGIKSIMSEELFNLTYVKVKE